MDFKLLMLASELFRGLKTVGDKKMILIAYGKYLSKSLNRDLIQDDFKISGRISCGTILKYFEGSIKNFYRECGFKYIRSKNLSDSELVNYILSNKKITQRDCWESTLKANANGRTRLKYRGKLVSLYRFMYSQLKEALKEDKILLHSCDNIKCFNPDHLSQGTHKQNAIDAGIRGLKSSKRGPLKYHKITDPYDYDNLLNFVKKHIIIDKDDAWLFPGSSKTYPCIYINKNKYLLHRLILANKIGKKYEEIDFARHVLPNSKRPNIRDINPDHLFEGTRRDNSLDSASYNKMYKMSEEKARCIRDAASQYDFSKRGNPSKFDNQWAETFNVRPCTIRNIRKGRHWHGSDS